MMAINTITKMEMEIMRNKALMIKINATFTSGISETSTNL